MADGRDRIRFRHCIVKILRGSLCPGQRFQPSQYARTSKTTPDAQSVVVALVICRLDLPPPRLLLGGLLHGLIHGLLLLLQ